MNRVGLLPSQLLRNPPDHLKSAAFPGTTMNLYSNKTTRVSIAALGALLSAWQFYLFVQSRDAAGQLDPQGGALNLWLAVGAAGAACAAIAVLSFLAVSGDRSVEHVAYYEQAHK